LQRAFNKHGESAFEFKILEIIKSLNYEDLITREQKYLDIFKPAYNVSQTADHPPGLKGKKLTEIHKKRISDANKGKKNCLGHQHSQESKDLMRLHHNKKSNGPRSIEYKKGVSERFKKWHASLTEEQKKERAKIASKAQAIIKETVCVICLKQFTYHSCGKFIPKTCSSECLKELRKNILHRHKQKHPEKFGINYWATLTEEQKKDFFKNRKFKDRKLPLIKNVCTVCKKDFEHSKKLKTCSLECLSALRKLNLAHHFYNKAKDLELNSNNKVKALCAFIKKYGHTPSHRSKNKEEAKLGHVLGSKRQGINGRGSIVFYDSDQKIVESFGYPNLFELDNPEANSNATCKKVCEWIRLHGKKPAIRSKDKEENKLADWIHSKRKAYKGQSGKFFSSDQGIAESYGYPTLFK
jgi:group I intron endonuclease